MAVSMRAAQSGTAGYTEYDKNLYRLTRSIVPTQPINLLILIACQIEYRRNDAVYKTAGICKCLEERDIEGVIGYRRPNKKDGYFAKCMVKGVID